jgi:uncharacterized protein (TIGR03435 family)
MKLRSAKFLPVVRAAAVLGCALSVYNGQSLPHAQSEPAATPKFEVASVKPTDPADRQINTMFVYAGGRFEARACTVNYLIQVAYNIQDWQISGGPKWAAPDGDRFDISAKPPAGSSLSKIAPSNPKLPPPDEERLMLRALMIDRFELVARDETQLGSALALVLKNRSPKLTDAKNKNAFPVVMYGPTFIPDRPAYMQGENASMALFAARLSTEFGSFVIDETGLQGSFDFKIEYVRDVTDANAAGPQLSTAIQELGLKLVPTKAPVRRIVIERIEKPSEN